MWQELLRDEDGQGLAEYAVIVGVVAVGAIGFLKLFTNGLGTGPDSIFGRMIQKLQGM